eukprot:CAMPEP_0178419162 /NCGR_PEP_ID=MMETSP0689_2-20121128/25467_1 /TAXON_ID=160604 /ORGANISM="Amphidinium massartii, Strain CS-259" /LENGTH=58 /DNA_ID=CAMNT_0020040589 /DNA_START=660 /DNA_END=833 /DNA_ORIENTATION=-
MASHELACPSSRKVVTMQNRSFLFASFITLKLRGGAQLARLAGLSALSNAPAAGGMKS